MPLYCLCGTDRTDGKGNRLARDRSAVFVDKQMQCEKTGAEQRLLDGSLHYPNVDVYRCSSCGTMIAKG